MTNHPQISIVFLMETKMVWHNLMLKVGRIGFDPQSVERVGYIEVWHFE
jgi:hypothetical protein